MIVTILGLIHSIYKIKCNNRYRLELHFRHLTSFFQFKCASLILIEDQV